MQKILKYLALFFLVLIVLFAVFLIYSTISDYSPEEKIVLFENENSDVINDSLELSIITWNIGYCGLSEDMDFFYSGGKMTRPTYEILQENLAGVKDFLSKNKETDFIILQEVDKSARRSFYVNEYDSISKDFPSYTCSYGKNYDVSFVPIPITNPMGKVDAGVMTLSKYKSESAIRYSFPGNFNWPKSLFMLDRCFLVNRYSISNDKELLIINTHNSAYDNGSLKEQQMNYLKDFIVAEYKKGNYVLVGGDWNQCPPEFYSNFTENVMDNESRNDINKDFLKEWKWLFNNNIPTNRRVKTPYKKGETLTTVIDFYLVSPNIQEVTLKNIDLGFKYSDHQPVKMSFRVR